MPLLHDPAVRASIESRLDRLNEESPRKWGSMSVDQMLWHVNQFLAASLGESTLPAQKLPMPKPVMHFFLLYMPWPKSAPTNKGAVARERHDFAAEQAKCRELIGRFVARPLDGKWPVDPSFGEMSGRNQSRLQAKHLDHHFRQFGA